jgi:shikimate kinase
LNQDLIALVGGRGAGKTTVGRLLATHLNFKFVDTDEQIKIVTGQTIAEIFQIAGEAAFRQLESAELRAAVGRSNAVIATGGGSIMSAANRDLLSSHCFVIWLKARHDVMRKRVESDPGSGDDRPLLVGESGGVDDILHHREPLYQATANFVVDTTDLSPSDVISAILAAC